MEPLGFEPTKEAFAGCVVRKRVQRTVSTVLSEVARVVPTTSSSGGYFDNRSTEENGPQRHTESSARIPARDRQAGERAGRFGRAPGDGTWAEREPGVQMAPGAARR